MALQDGRGQQWVVRTERDLPSRRPIRVIGDGDSEAILQGNYASLVGIESGGTSSDALRHFVAPDGSKPMREATAMQPALSRAMASVALAVLRIALRVGDLSGDLRKNGVVLREYLHICATGLKMHR
jgi:hypothetical protein